MGAVYLARDRRLKRQVAVKVLHPATEPSAEAQERFSREAELLARLSHPSLPKVLDFFLTEEGAAMVMEYIAGPDLGEVVKEARRKGRRLPIEQVRGWAEALCDALTYLHLQEPPILHRDIKPNNIKLAPDGTIRLVDFGIALALPDADDDEHTMTEPRALGTLPYLPLEQYGADLSDSDPRTDLYGLGATLYHLVTGQQPLSAQERFLRPERFQPPSALRPDLPPAIESAILRAMALKPEERPTSAALFKQMLMGELPAAEPPPPPPTLAEALLANLPLALLALALLVIALLYTLG